MTEEEAQIKELMADLDQDQLKDLDENQKRCLKRRLNYSSITALIAGEQDLTCQDLVLFMIKAELSFLLWSRSVITKINTNFQI